MKRETLTKLFAIVGLFGMVISVIGTAILIVYEMSQNRERQSSYSESFNQSSLWQAFSGEVQKSTLMLQTGSMLHTGNVHTGSIEGTGNVVSPNK